MALARQALAGLAGARAGECSPVYLTEPQDVRGQPWFANQVVRLYCASRWTAQGLLHSLLAIERDMGRIRRQRKGPRIIDLDLLLFNDLCLDTPDLILPHPRMVDRAFVLVPLQDISPDYVFPNGKTLVDVLNSLTFTLDGRRIQQP